MKQGLNFHIFEAWLFAVSILVHHVALLKFFFFLFWQYFFLLEDSSYNLVFRRSSTVKHSIDLTTIQSHVPAIKEKCKVKYQVQQAQNQQQPYNQQADNEKMRFTLKKIFFVFLTLLIILIGYLLLQSVDLQRIRELLHDSEKFDLESLKHLAWR